MALKTKKSLLSPGYSLIEVLVYTFLLSIFLLLLSQLFIAVKEINAHSASLVGLQKNTRQVLTELTKNLREASSVALPVPGGTSESLSLNSGAIVYQVEEGILTKTVSGETLSDTTPEVTILDPEFTYMAEATQTAAVKIYLTIESNYLLSNGRRLSQPLETTVSLR